ncbi:MAG: hypothetical protein KatS3mg036_0353 [Ignavibacterium sp.]|nr:MAG: hypothetical protein KatS3mg036_0353 [Ignavibacterium sp.]
MKTKIMGRPAYLLILLLATLLLFSCKDESNPVDNIQTFASSTKTILPNSDGIIELTNNNGDQIKLIIPAYALQDTTAITLEVMNSVLTNPFSQNILTTIRILPDGLKLDSAATISVTFKSAISDTTHSILYYRKQNDIAYPLETKWLNNNTVVGKIFHFSDYGGAQPTYDEITSQSNKLNYDFNYGLWDWQGFSQYVVAMLKYIEFFQLYGDNEHGKNLLVQLEQKIINQVNAFLDLPIPEEPCGYYLQTLMNYSSFVFNMVSDEQTEQRIQDRINEVLNRCYVRGELEFAYDYCVSAEGAEICRTITGFVPFNVNTTIEPLGQINGSGNLDWTGTMTGLPSNCIYNEVGTVNVTLGGEMVLDDQAVLWMEFEIYEHASGTVTAGCDGINHTLPFNPPDVTHNIRILAQDGAELIMPIPGTTGHFKWILHLIFMP